MQHFLRRQEAMAVKGDEKISRDVEFTLQPPSAPKPSYAPSATLEPPPLVVQPPPPPQQQPLPSLQPMTAGTTTNLQPQFQHLQPPPPPTAMLQQQHSTTAPTQTIALPTTPLPNSAIQVRIYEKTMRTYTKCWLCSNRSAF